MSITTSYFAVSNKIQGTKISISRFTLPRVRKGIDSILISFAPSRELLNDYKNKSISWSTYCQRYTSEQREHYKMFPENFAMLLDRAKEEKLILLCYERFEGKATKCHRILLYDILKKISQKERLDIEFIDEK